MDLTFPLFVGKLICLAPVRPEQDAEVESRWTHDAGYLRMFGYKTIRPISSAQVKKVYEELDRQGDQGKNKFYLAIRLLPDERLVGFAKIYSIGWTHGAARMQLGIGDPADRGKGFGGEALRLLLRYAFEELNLYRLTAAVPEYNQPALRLFEKAGFRVEVCQRQLLHRDGRRWDMLGLGLLRRDWEQGKQANRDRRGE